MIFYGRRYKWSEWLFLLCISVYCTCPSNNKSNFLAHLFISSPNFVGSIQSSLRKYTREGVWAFGKVCWTEARGNTLFIAASTTWRLLKHQWTCRQLYLQPNVDSLTKVSYFCRSSACELTCMVIRIVLAGIGVLLVHVQWQLVFAPQFVPLRRDFSLRRTS
jgi:hypothetical protein